MFVLLDSTLCFRSILSLPGQCRDRNCISSTIQNTNKSHLKRYCDMYRNSNNISIWWNVFFNTIKHLPFLLIVLSSVCCRNSERLWYIYIIIRFIIRAGKRENISVVENGCMNWQGYVLCLSSHGAKHLQNGLRAEEHSRAWIKFGIISHNYRCAITWRIYPTCTHRLRRDIGISFAFWSFIFDITTYLKCIMY